MTAAPAAAPAGNWLVRFYGSTIGRKVVMALTGIILVGFITIHMAGNLLVHQGAEAMNAYAEFLKSKPPLLWGTRIVVLLAVLFHAHAAITLSRRAQGARPDRYAGLKAQASTLSARLMRAGGVLLLVFLVFHILHFTTGTVLPSQFVDGEAYQNVVRSFSIAWVTIFYVVAMAALTLHLHHGVWSLFQTLGANHPHFNGARKKLAWLLAIVVPVGFVSVPIAVALGLAR
ncbi:MAG: succinate dehydrogenase cytochrome b subunit [Gemmatimonadetes bacterium]|nr:succinate dehydrogenase cytochrome b subunit [Gemmatimonadota bacterium]MCC7133280.1 succinate dehydrogenase cytochrome b subunit [Gemmatimonadales bacterium]